jgi:hypothetical protein
LPTRTLLLAPVAVAVVAAGGAALCGALGWPPHVRAMANAAATCLAASALAAVPLVLTRGASQYAVAQAGLVATMIHLFVAAGVGVAFALAKRMDAAYAYWLLAFYFPTLATVVAAAVRAVKAAPPATPLTKQ